MASVTAARPAAGPPRDRVAAVAAPGGHGPARERRSALGGFLRSRRERLTPEMVGMPPGARRRTPGLRREEVALLAGVGVTWYTWLEQGRRINASAQVLGAVARVLRLEAPERAHLFALADVLDPDAENPPSALSPAVEAILDRLDPYPAVVIGPRCDILAGNRAHLLVIGDYLALPCRFRNSLWLFFTDPGLRGMSPDWDANAPRMVAQFRATMADHYGEPAWADLLALLRRHSPEFDALWQRQDVAGMDGCYKTLLHPDVGQLRLEVNHMWLAENPDTRVTTYVPRDADTRARLERLAEFAPRPLAVPPEARLHAVPSRPHADRPRATAAPRPSRGG